MQWSFLDKLTNHSIRAIKAALNLQRACPSRWWRRLERRTPKPEGQATWSSIELLKARDKQNDSKGVFKISEAGVTEDAVGKPLLISNTFYRTGVKHKCKKDKRNQEEYGRGMRYEYRRDSLEQKKPRGEIREEKRVVIGIDGVKSTVPTEDMPLGDGEIKTIAPFGFSAQGIPRRRKFVIRKKEKGIGNTR